MKYGNILKKIWILAQFYGHFKIEQRAPALMTNLLLTINAPLFVNIEIFYYLFGYRGNAIKRATHFILKDIVAYKKSRKLD